MQQTQQRIQHAAENQTRGGCAGGLLLGHGLAVVQAREVNLGHLQVPVTDLVPCEVVEGLVGLGELVLIQRSVDLGADLFQAVQDPAVGVGELVTVRQLAHVGPVHQRKAGGVEQLGSEVTGALSGVITDRQVRAWVSATRQREAKCVRTVVADPVQRVNAIAEGLRHLATLLIADQTVQEDILKRHLRTTVAPLTQR